MLLIGLLAWWCNGSAGEDVSQNINIGPARVYHPNFNMVFDPNGQVLWVFAPDSAAPVEVTPNGGWSWYSDHEDVEMREKRMYVKLFGNNGETQYSFEIKYTNKAIAYIKINPYIGIDMINAEGENKPKKDRNWRSASVVVLQEEDFEVIADTYEWTTTSRKITLGSNKSSKDVAFCTDKGPSNSEKNETINVALWGRHKNSSLKSQLKGTAKFTIVKVNVNICNMGELKEDDPGYICAKSPMGSNKVVMFSCDPKGLSTAAKGISIKLPNKATLFDVSSTSSSGTTAPSCPELSTTTSSAVDGKAYWLNTSELLAGTIRIEHNASFPRAVDEAKYACWGLKFVTPAGDPVKDPVYASVDGQNEFCYDDNTRKCVVNLKVKVHPSGITGLTLAEVKKSFSGGFSIGASPEPRQVAIEWDKDLGGQAGKWESDGGDIVCRSRATYSGMPKKSNSFGKKEAAFGAGANAISAKFEIFFEKKGKGHPECTLAGCKKDCPNWFYYWRQGAVPGLAHENVVYKELGENTGGLFEPGDPYSISISDFASMSDADGECQIQKYLKSGLREAGNGIFVGIKGLVGGSSVTIGIPSEYCGVAFAAAVVCHEECHRDIWQASRGKRDLDGDDVADVNESAFGLTTYPNVAASYDFLDKRTNEVYKVYLPFVDDEIRARLKSRDILKGGYYDPSEDWAKPGCQSGDYYGPPKGK